MKSLLIPFALLIASFLMLQANAYFNVTYLNTTVMLQNDTSAHVIEVITLFMSNSSVPQYLHYPSCLGLSL